jgi:hypothetical protein
VYISDDLTWGVHIKEIHKKASQKLYFLILLRRSGASAKDLYEIFTYRIRPIIEYAFPVWHTRLTKGQSKLLESIQKHAMNIINPNMKYTETLTLFNITTLHKRRTQLCKTFFQRMLSPKHKLHYLLADARNVSVELRKPKRFPRPKAKTNRFKDSLVCYGLYNWQ